MSGRIGYRQPRGERLRDRRRELGLTQAAVATAAGVRPQEVAKYEKGEIPAAPAKAEGIARALAINIDAAFEPPAASEKAAALMAAAGRCGSPRCGDPKCTTPKGQCHAVDCTEPAKLAAETNTWAREVAGQPRMFCGNECAMRTIGKTTKGSAKEYWTTSEGQAVLAHMGDERRRRVEVTCRECGRVVERVLSKAQRGGENNNFCSNVCAKTFHWTHQIGVADAVVRRWSGRTRQVWYGRWNGWKGKKFGIDGLEHARAKGGRPPNMTDEQQKILELHREGLSTRKVAEAVFGDARLKDRVARFLRR
jgi:DNA-binding XRE family transcriptional regulator